MRFLPDTNIIIGWLAGRNPAIIDKMADHRRDIALSAIVLHKLAFGAFNSKHVDRNLRQLDDLGLPVLAFDNADAVAAGDIRARLKRAGTPIGPYDLLIAGQAIARGLTVVTANTSEFARVAGLQLDNWIND